MKNKKLFFFPLFFSICSVAVQGAKDPKTSQESPGTLSPSLAKFFKGELKENVEKLIGTDFQLLNRQDEFAELEEKLEKIYRTLTYKKTLFEKEEKAGIRSQDYIPRLKTAYEKWVKLEQKLQDWKRVEESIPTEIWADIENGLRVLEDVQKSKSQVENRMRELEVEHDVYASTPKIEQLEKGSEALKKAHDKVKKETLSKLQSTLKNLLDEKVEIFDKIETLEMIRQIKLEKAALSWINEKNDVIQDTKNNLEIIFKGAAKSFSSQEDIGEITQNLDLKKLQKHLKEKFNKSIRFLVEQYEQKLTQKMREHGTNPKLTQEIIHDRIQFKKQQNYLYDTGYFITKFKLSKNPLQSENAIFDIIDTILKFDPQYLNKGLAKKLIVKAKLLRDNIDRNSECKVNIGKTESGYRRMIAKLAYRFESEVLMVIMHEEYSIEELVSQEVMKTTEKFRRAFQALMDYFGKMEQCAQTWQRSKDIAKKIGQFKKML